MVPAARAPESCNASIAGRNSIRQRDGVGADAPFAIERSAISAQPFPAAGRAQATSGFSIPSWMFGKRIDADDPPSGRALEIRSSIESVPASVFENSATYRKDRWRVDQVSVNHPAPKRASTADTRAECRQRPATRTFSSIHQRTTQVRRRSWDANRCLFHCLQVQLGGEFARCEICNPTSSHGFRGLSGQRWRSTRWQRTPEASSLAEDCAAPVFARVALFSFKSSFQTRPGRTTIAI